MSLNATTYRPAGPVSASFLRDDTYVRALLGPVGSGKTTTCIFDILKNANEMPTGRDGVRRSRGLVVRDTYRNLYNTTIKSWWDWFPKTLGNWTGGQDRPAEHHLRFDPPEGKKQIGPLELEVRFAAIGDDSVENALRGYEPTWAWMNEADLLSEDCLDYLITRTGRYPPQRFLKPGTVFRDYVMMDFNAPDVDNWLFKRFVEDVPPKHKLFRMAGGRSPDAENTANLQHDYYEKQVEANKNRPDIIRRMVDAEFGYSRDGVPVYHEYQDQLHCADEPLKVYPDIPFRLGLDAGIQPGAVFAQWMPDGQWRIFKELTFKRMGATSFAKQLKIFLSEHGGVKRLAEVYVDPTAYDGADKESGELAWVEKIEAKLGVPIMAAPSNEPVLRQEAVRIALNHNIDGKPGLLLCPTCKVLRKGFNSGYRYKVHKMGNTTSLSPKPEKNDYSHVHDGLQYVMLGGEGRGGVIYGGRNRPDGIEDDVADSNGEIQQDHNIFG